MSVSVNLHIIKYPDQIVVRRKETGRRKPLQLFTPPSQLIVRLFASVCLVSELT